MKAFFSKVWSWILANKIISIIIAGVLVVGITLAIVLPIALKHKHDFGTELQVSETHHYYVCECGEKKDETAHVYDQEVAESAYLHTEATATTNGVYYKSCVCGAKSATETFELDKIATTLTLTVDSKVYDGQQIAPTYNTNSDAEIVVLYYQWDATANSGAGDWKLLSVTIPKDVGQYKVRVAARETTNYQYKEIEEEFAITKKAITGTFNQNAIYGQTTGEGINTRYDFTLGTEYGVIEGDEVYLRVFYKGNNTGAAYDRSVVVVAAGSNRLTANNYDWSGLTVTSTIVHDFESAIVIDCQSEYSNTMNVTAGQVIYLKIMGAEGTLNDFYFKATSDSTATYTYELFKVNDKTTPVDSNATAGQHEIYQDICGTSDYYLVVTCVTGGEISITSAQ